ncbi:MAG: hypothetical protein IJW60_04225 [Clostridia bacterium]|nr:hypothetical protein [Clostridia bacterium]
MMDAFYEESAINSNATRDKRIYMIFNIVSFLFLTLAILLLFIFLWCFPWGQVTTDEGRAWQFFFGFLGVMGLSCLLTWFLLSKFKARFNVSYDYVFVSGELRISKVFNVNRRRLVARIDCEDMIQVGDMDNPSYARFKADPTNKEVICTPNYEPAKGKFFMYILANCNGKKLFVLECRENLLMNIMKFAKRSVLESDYVMQERKQK